MTPDQCPRYPSCSATLCIYDDQFKTRAYAQNDPICYYVRCAGKADASEKLGQDLVDRSFQLLEHFREQYAEFYRRALAAHQTPWPGASLHE